MSGIIGSKLNIRSSGRVAKLGTDGQVLTSSGAGVATAFEDIAAGISWQAIETGSTMTAVAGEAYWIDTSSNACTITLPSSASNGDQIIFADYARTWGTYGIELDSNGLNYQGQDDSYTVEYGTEGTALHIVYSGATNGWIPILDEDVADAPTSYTSNENGIFVYGETSGGFTAISNLVSSVGVVASDVAGVGTARSNGAGTEYGGDKAIVAYGYMTGTGNGNASNLITNVGVVGTDVTGVGTARNAPAGCEYGGDKGIIAYGSVGNVSNLISNVGVVATDVTGVGTSRTQLAACEYGGDKGIFGYGSTGSVSSLTNLVSNVGVVAADTTGVGSARTSIRACSYGSTKGIFGYGEIENNSEYSMTNLVSDVGVVATDTTGVGTARRTLAACEYGGDKGIFGFGNDDSKVGMTNLVSNSGVVATDVAAVGTARSDLAACSYN